MPYGYYSPSVHHQPQEFYEEPTTSVPTGTFLHKGFYDLLAIIPTPSPSRLLWKALTLPLNGFEAGRRYDRNLTKQQNPYLRKAGD